MADGATDPFAGADAARDELAGVTARLRAHSLNETQIEVAEKAIRRAVAELGEGADKAAAGLALADKVGGFLSNPRTLLSVIGL